MRPILKTFFLLFIPAFSFAQTNAMDSLTQALQHEKQDTSRIFLLAQLSNAYLFSRPDTALMLAQEGLMLAKKTSFAKGEAVCLNRIANTFSITGDYPKALQLHLEALKKAETIDDKKTLTAILVNIGNDYASQGDYLQSVNYTRKALNMAESIPVESLVLAALVNLGEGYEKLNSFDTALLYSNRAYDLAGRLGDAGAMGIALTNLGNIYSKNGQEALAMTKYNAGKPYLVQEEMDEALCHAYLGMAKLFQKRGERDSSLYYAKLSLTTAQKAGLTSRVMDASSFLTGYYKAIHNVDSAFVYQSATMAAKDSLFSQEKQRDFQRLGYEEAVRQQQLQEAKEEAQTELKFKMLFGGVGALLIVAFLLLRNNWQRRKANDALSKKNRQIESTLSELKATQAQLVQREKMASLGELMAGIAHEIQNPLNFVNNFSEISKELVVELKQEADNGNRTDVKMLADDVLNNLDKVVHHGKRADSIVKGMLQHARSSNSKKEPININQLAEEYLQISYQEQRAKDKNFAAVIQKNFDVSAPKVEAVSQDIGRVLLNLYNNAFYAVSKKKEQLKGAFEPIIIVNTKREGDNVLISVKDNGVGMSAKVAGKVFQPFFTTKPTGEGTGLGLSLSYDIVTKGHGGTLSVQSKEGEGSEFVVKLPI